MPISFPITPVANHNLGFYPDTVRHINNGDPANQEYFGLPTKDLEYRTEILRQALNELQADYVSQVNSLELFDSTHDHSTASGQIHLNLQKIYTNTDPDNSYISIAANKILKIKKSGGQAAPDILQIVENAGTPKTQFIFPGSDALYDHQAALASDQAVAPHGLRLAARLSKISDSCLVAPGNNVVLTGVNTVTGFTGLPVASLTSPFVEGIITGSQAAPAPELPQNIVSVVLASTGAPIMSGSDRVFGLLDYNTGTSTWSVVFHAAGSLYTFGAPTTVRLYGQYAYSLSTVSVVDPRVIFAAKNGETNL